MVKQVSWCAVISQYPYWLHFGVSKCSFYPSKMCEDNSNKVIIYSAYKSPTKPLIYTDLEMMFNVQERIILQEDLNAKHKRRHYKLTTIRGISLTNHSDKYKMSATTEPRHYSKLHRPDIVDTFARCNFPDNITTQQILH